MLESYKDYVKPGAQCTNCDNNQSKTDKIIKGWWSVESCKFRRIVRIMRKICRKKL